MGHLTKSIIIKNIKENMGMSLCLKRRERGLSLHKLSQITNIPVEILDEAESGKGPLLKLSIKLAIFYRVNVKIKLEK